MNELLKAIAAEPTGILIGAILFLVWHISKYAERFSLFQKSLEQIGSRFEKLESKFEKLESKFEKALERFEDRFEQIESRFENKLKHLESKVENKLKHLESRFEKRFEQIESRFEKLENKFEKLSAIVSELVTKVNMLCDKKAKPTSKSASPTVITDFGEDLRKRLGADETLERICKESQKEIISYIGESKSAYDIQVKSLEWANKKLIDYLNDKELNALKDIAYIEGIPMENIYTVFGLLLRDKIFKVLNIRVPKREAKQGHDESQSQNKPTEEDTSK